MKPGKRHRTKWRISGIGRPSAVALLVCVIGTISTFQLYNAPRPPILQNLEDSAHPFLRDRLPFTVMSGKPNMRHGGMSCRTVHPAAIAALDFQVSKPSFAYEYEFIGDGLFNALLVNSALAVRAPPATPRLS
ncbi:MAG: hypothetical protein ABFD98_10530 [Syntrophobacteraceae bacterium]|nr:hypothetical protein [Desulfobacteraceae bacterium]